MNPIFKRHKLELVLFLLPVIILFSLIMIVPLVRALMISFTKWNGVTDAVFVGFDNYKRLYTSPDLVRSITNSLLYSGVLTIYQVGLGVFFAFILTSRKTKASNLFKNIYFFPVLLSVSVVAQLWISIYHGDFGLINQFSKAFGSEWQQNWLNEPVKGIVAIVIAEAWKGMGYHLLIIYAAMKNVPHMYYEASLIDGASRWNQFRCITLPLVMPTVKMCMILCLTYGFRAFEMIYIMTAGGPGNYTHTLPIMMYKALFGLQKYGYASAISVVIVVICVGLMQVIDKLTLRFESHY